MYSMRIVCVCNLLREPKPLFEAVLSASKLYYVTCRDPTKVEASFESCCRIEWSPRSHMAAGKTPEKVLVGVLMEPVPEKRLWFLNRVVTGICGNRGLDL